LSTAERCGEAPPTVANAAMIRGGVVAFFVGLVLFVGLCGYLDTRLPWPRRGRDER